MKQLVLRKIRVGVAFGLALAALWGTNHSEASDEFHTEFARANALYEAGEFAKAAEVYEGLLGRLGHSAAVYYNLGNAQFRLGDTGRAALSYERALLLRPSHPEAKANLEFVRASTAARLFPKTFWDRIYDRVPAEGVVWVAAAAIWTCVAGAWLWVRRKTLRPHGVIAVLMALPLAAACFALLAFGGGGGWTVPRGIVIRDGCVARHAPATSSREILALRPASQVEILSRRGAWTYVGLPDGGRGWLPSETVESIRL